MIEALGKLDRRLGFEARGMRRQLGPDAEPALDYADRYLEAYCAFHGVDAAQAVQAIARFAERYVEDLQVLAAEGLQPFQRDARAFELSRVDYDICLMSSFLYCRHRYGILRELFDFQEGGRRAAFIGVGSGIEIGPLQDRFEELSAFDLVLSDFPRQRFPEVRFVEGPFASAPESLDAVFAIELLEHLDDPYALVTQAAESLAPGGVLVCTTTSQVPQFDHRYDFPSREAFEEAVRAVGLQPQGHRDLPHACSVPGVAPCNTVHVLGKE